MNKMDNWYRSTIMPKHYKEMVDEIINKMDEDASANSVAGGGVDMAPNAGKKKKKDDEVPSQLMNVILKRMGGNIKENSDNNNVVLRGVLNTIEKLEEKIDKVSGVVKEEVKIVEEKQRFVDKFKIK